MIKLNKITDYAVVILGLLSSRFPNKFSTSKISEDTGLPVPTVAKVCKLLNKSDLILAGRGANGGYVLEKPASEIKLSNIIFAVDEEVKTLNCKKNSKKGCNNKTTKCITHNLWDQLDQHINGFFEKVKLQDLTKIN